MIQISDQAIKQLENLKEQESKKASYLRVSVKEGGCSGFSYKLDFDPETNERDKTFKCKGIPIVIDPKSLLYIMGMTLDFDGGLNGKGFIFSNPNAKKSCGCGFSFGV